jgi:hypothetical protein
MVIENIDFSRDSCSRCNRSGRGLALVQKEQWRLIILEGTHKPTVLRMEKQEILLKEPLIRKMISRCHRRKRGTDRFSLAKIVSYFLYQG